MINMSCTPFPRGLAATFTLAGASLMAGCATTPQQGCDYTKVTDAKINQMTPLGKRATDQFLGAIPGVGTIAFTVKRINEDQCKRAAPAPAAGK